MGCELILDGYTRTADCRGLTVTFRPFSASEWSQLRVLSEGYPPAERAARAAAAIADRIDSWDATIKGEPAEVSGPNVEMLPPAVSDRLENLLLGYTTEGVNTQEADAKNSEAA